MTGGREPTGPTPDACDDQGRRHGLWTDPDAHGGVMVGGYVDGLRQGRWRHLSTDGRLRSQGDYLDDQLHGSGPGTGRTDG
jgi:hypothetical protein